MDLSVTLLDTNHAEVNMNLSMNDLMRMVIDILPNASFSEDADGQIVVHTNLQQVDPDPEQPLVDMGD